ncbi:MAG: sigma-70 family RNA polymerase sigma factor [Candidatus Eremiobacteraeota bacterium]|nr:sigma-70 family RNA polymerase sigma factor [Candidatus Eremiobacteraeota bacterium]
MTDPDRDAAIARYRAEPTVERRNDVVDAYRDLCTRGARKFKRAHNDRADLEQVAALGLIKAVERYRPEMQTPFQAYAWIVIVGELMHYVRDFERLVRAPRALLALERPYIRAWDAFITAYQREPTTAELAAVLGEFRETIVELRSFRRVEHISLPEPESADGPERVDLLADVTVGIALEERVALILALEELGERERTVVLGTFAAGLTQAEIGARLGVSQSHVSKLLAKALGKLGRRVAYG